MQTFIKSDIKKKNSGLFERMSRTYDFEIALNEFEKETLLIEQETR